MRCSQNLFRGKVIILKPFKLKNKYGTSLLGEWLRTPCQGRGHGFNPWSRKLPHAVEQVKLGGHNYWACRLRACAPQKKKPPRWQAHAPPGRVAPTCCTNPQHQHRSENLLETYFLEPHPRSYWVTDSGCGAQQTQVPTSPLGDSDA